ncbi:MAG: hypothetical protein JNM45_06855 [Rhizobiales bacterium]|nr:hypothetical protein [Hyphomicrobiales bacterium]
MKKIIILATGFTLISSLAALAGEPYLPRTEKAFQRIDTNKDGKVELGEFTPVASRSLNRLDGNGDKQVTAQEMESALQKKLHQRVEKMMALLDTDRNGVVTEAELDKVSADMFNSADNDHDGGLSMTEAHDFKRSAWRKSYLAQAANVAGSGH